MIRTKNLFSFAAVAAFTALCSTSLASAAPFRASAAFSGGYGNGNNGCQGGNQHGGNGNDCQGGNGGGHHGGGHNGGGHNGGGHNGGGHNGGGCNGGGNTGGPVCDAGGPYNVECGDGPLTVALDATGSTGATSFLWSTNFAGAVIADPTAAQTTVTFTPAATNCCPSQFYVSLTVGDGTRSRSCSTTVRVRDTQPPVIVCPPLAKVICGMDESPASTGYPEVLDNCDTDVQVTFCDRIVLQPCRAERLDHSVERTWRARDNCGNVATCVQIIHSVKVVVPVDALPGVCPNVVNFNDCAPVRFAILGTESFNVANVRWNTLKLYGEHCEGGPVLPLCVYPADVGTPYFGDVTNCECTDANGDGRLDLVVTFRRSQVVQNLGLCNLPSGSNKRVVLVGKLCDGCSFIGTDCVRVP
ncbi:MAG: hypothetical protein IPJ77_18275 [Planctomycetes bacterium]|nr:hypothetical protein [Planctomycetota bacterium]